MTKEWLKYATPVKFISYVGVAFLRTGLMPQLTCNLMFKSKARSHNARQRATCCVENAAEIKPVLISALCDARQRASTCGMWMGLKCLLLYIVQTSAYNTQFLCVLLRPARAGSEWGMDCQGAWHGTALLTTCLPVKMLDLLVLLHVIAKLSYDATSLLISPIDHKEQRAIDGKL